MNSRIFPSIMELCHRHWLSSALSLPVNGRVGIDLLGKKVGVELKSQYNKWEGSHAVHNYQVREFRKANRGCELYWAFLLYGLSETPAEIHPTTDQADLEAFVTSRVVHCLPWSWIRQFRITYPPTGPYRHVPRKSFPETDYFIEYESSDGSPIFAPKDSALVAHLDDPVPF